MKLYEGMFVIDAGRASREWEETLKSVTAVLEKHGASIEKGHRFDERKLAYPIQGVRRGVYLLQYFNADPEAIAEMRVDLNLSETVLRYMILRVDAEQSPELPTLGTATPTPADAVIPGRETPAEAPKVEAVVVEAPKADEKKAEAAEAPKADEKKADEKKADEKKAEAPAETPAEAPAEAAAKPEAAPAVAVEAPAEETADEKKEEA